MESRTKRAADHAFGHTPRHSRWAFALLAISAVPFVGCEPPPISFRQNRVLIRKYELETKTEFTDRQLADLGEVLTDLFGAPNAPDFPNDEELAGVVDLDVIAAAAGPVQKGGGLYRQHCAHCHGLAGDGLGPTAWQMNPYPRDFRAGKFAYKSTPIGVRPTDGDLARTLRQGVPGTAMPGFPQLGTAEIASLTQYVKYLSIRGECERLLIDASAQLDADDGERLDKSDEFLFEEIVLPIVGQWQFAEELVTQAPPRPNVDLAASIRRGRNLFYGPVAKCSSCHGETGMGDGDRRQYDDWTTEIEPARPDRVKQYVAAGALPPRNILPHNLRLGIYRGGRQDADLYRRIFDGIEGTPMPPVSPELSTDDVWALVDYVRSLPFENVTFVSEGSLVVRPEDVEGDLHAIVTTWPFFWQIQYAGEDGKFGTLDDLYAANELHLPVGEEVDVWVRNVSLVQRLSFRGAREVRQSRTEMQQRLTLLAPATTAETIYASPRMGLGHSTISGRLVCESADELTRYLAGLAETSPTTEGDP
jgi:mono/diheme cytochrome c family protein